jgi:hypothetical protein
MLVNATKIIMTFIVQLSTRKLLSAQLYAMPYLGPSAGDRERQTQLRL